MLPLIFLPALMVMQAPEPPAPALVEVSRGVYILKGVPSPAVYHELKRLKISLVIDFRGDDEITGGLNTESAILMDQGTSYMRYALTRTPPASDFTFIREYLRSQSFTTRVLLHCSNGNRAAAAVCPWLVLERGMKVEAALQICEQAGLVVPETEKAVREYLANRQRS